MNRRARGGWFALFAGLVFSAGLATGLLLRQYIEPTPAAAGPPGAFPGSPTYRGVMGMLIKELDLTQAQQRQLEAILTARRRKLGHFRDEMRSRFEAERTEAFAEIRRILTPEQQRRFETFTSGLRDTERPFVPHSDAISPPR